MKHIAHIFRLIAFATLVVVSGGDVWAQDTIQSRVPKAQIRRQLMVATAADSVAAAGGPASATMADSIKADTLSAFADVSTDTLRLSMLNVELPQASDVASALQQESKQFIPDPKKAMWLAIVFPGGGQIYNRKYWKLPLIYGGFLGCVYALNWNNMMYRDYSQAYIDIMDSDPATKSYENFVPRGYDINRNLTRVQDLFRRKKNYYRRYRDLSMFIMIGVYALSIVDAYVDAELSSFDISRDLSMKVRPSIITAEKYEMAQRGSLATQSYGVRCSVNF